MSIEPEHRRVLRQETLVSMAINALLPSAIIWLLDVTPPQTLVGEQPLVAAMLPAAGMATLAMTLILTLIIRARVRSGSLPALDWPAAERGTMRFIPASLPLRAVALGLLAIVLLVPTGLAVAAQLPILPFDKIHFLLFNLLFGAIVGLVMARFVVLPALADPR